MNKPPYGDLFRRNAQSFRMFEVTSQSLPNKTVKVSQGSYVKNGKEIIEYIGANSPEINPPTTGAKWVLVSLTPNNTILVTEGEPASNSPPVPALTETNLPLALVYYKNNDTVITQDMIYDVRPFFGIYFDTEEKVTLPNFNEMLSNAVGSLRSVVDSKADMDGTNASEFTINREETGALSSDAFISVNRGQETKVSIRWNEDVDKWQYTNDGISYVNFGSGSSSSSENASSTVLGNVKLTADPVVATNPIAVADNDSRLFTAQQKIDTLGHIESTNSDPHNTLSLLTATNLPDHTHTLSEITDYTVPVLADHTHTLSEITDYTPTSNISTYSAVIGDGTLNIFNISHNLNKPNIVTSVKDTVTSNIVYPDLKVLSNNEITVEFATTPALNQYNVSIIAF